MNTLEDKINFIVKYNYKNLLQLPNVERIGLGYKFINSYNTKKPCIHVLVKNKIPSDSLNFSSIIPTQYMGIKTDVIDLGGKVTQYSLKNRVRPLEYGYSIGASLYKTGTLTCVVFRRKLIGKNYFLLSNNHVFADNNKLPLGSKIIQPSHEDGGKSETDLVANLSEFVPLKFESLVHTYVNYVDAAIAKVTKTNLISNKIALIGRLNGVASATLNESVRKVGRTTGLTEGKIQTLNATIKIHPPSLPELLFKNQIIANIHQDFGDSGSILVNKDNKVLGLFMGGASSYSGIFNDFQDVLKYTKTELFI